MLSSDPLWSDVVIVTPRKPGLQVRRDCNSYSTYRSPASFDLRSMTPPARRRPCSITGRFLSRVSILTRDIDIAILGTTENAGVENAGADCKGGKCRSKPT